MNEQYTYDTGICITSSLIPSLHDKSRLKDALIYKTNLKQQKGSTFIATASSKHQWCLTALILSVHITLSVD